jgi:hypothetical protein
MLKNERERRYIMGNGGKTIELCIFSEYQICTSDFISYLLKSMALKIYFEKERTGME